MGCHHQRNSPKCCNDPLSRHRLWAANFGEVWFLNPLVWLSGGAWAADLCSLGMGAVLEGLIITAELVDGPNVAYISLLLEGRVRGVS